MNKNDFYNFLGILVFPIVAIVFIIISPILLILMYVNYKREESQSGDN